MKPLYIICLLITIAGCKKVEQKVQENLIVNIMTNGQWKVTSLIKGNMDSTSLYINYKFQFKSNNTVDAINNGVIENTGNWAGDINTHTISANFVNPSSALRLLNGSWIITDSSPTSVIANQTVNGEVKTLKLDKI